MLRPNPKGLIISGVFTILTGALLIVSYNQFIIQEEMTSQVKFDIKVMNQDQKIWKMLEQKVATASSISKAPTPTSKEVRPSVTVEPSLSNK